MGAILVIPEQPRRVTSSNHRGLGLGGSFSFRRSYSKSLEPRITAFDAARKTAPQRFVPGVTPRFPHYAHNVHSIFINTPYAKPLIGEISVGRSPWVPRAEALRISPGTSSNLGIAKFLERCAHSYLVDALLGGCST